jgi:nitrate/TMAO reductase-like tetraheme cytochrome c subunit
MLHRKIYNYIIAGCFIFAAGLILAGCNSSKATHDEKTAAAAPQSEKGSAQLWSETCSQCHNLRSPTSYSQNEWQVAMHHMRVRGNLTGEEQRKILTFLQASN